MPHKDAFILFLGPLLNPEKHARVVDLAEVHRDAVMYAVRRDWIALKIVLALSFGWWLWRVPIYVLLKTPIEPWVNPDKIGTTWVTLPVMLAFYWIIPFAFVIAVAWLANNAILLRRLSRLESVNFCHTCRYPLERVDGAKCPECGNVRDLKAEQAETSDT